MKVLPALLVSMVGTLNVWANGGAWQTGVPGAGNVASSREGKATTVGIEDERLTIDLHQEFAAVEVFYKMRNEGPALTQDFYFPVDQWSSDLENYTITVDGKPVKVEEIGAKKKTGEEDGWGLLPHSRAWKFSKIPFKKGQKQEVVIRYLQRYAVESSAVSAHGRVEEAKLRYMISPAATWAGLIGKGKVTINVLHPLPEDVRVDRPEGRFKKVNERRYEWAFEKLEPTEADDILVVAHPDFNTWPTGYGEDGGSSYVTQDEKAYLIHTTYDVKASSTLPAEGEKSYMADNVKGGAEGRAWVEGAEGDGVGESLEFTIKNPLPLEAILITPGYAAQFISTIFPAEETGKTSPLWWRNNRVAEVKITLNCEHTFTAMIPNEEFFEPYPIPVRGYNKPVKTVRLEIAGVHRGTTYRDTCISLVAMKAKLARKPKVTPVR